MADKTPFALRRVRLPEHPILYTLDQVAVILSLTDTQLRTRVSFTGREVGGSSRMRAINISDAGAKPEWRISERELKLWLARHGYKLEE